MTPAQLDFLGRIIGHLEDCTTVRQVHAHGRSTSTGDDKVYHEKQYEELSSQINNLHRHLEVHFNIKVV